MHAGSSSVEGVPAQQRSLRTLLVVALCCLFISGTSGVARAETTAAQVVNLNVEGARPVAKAVESLIEKYGYQITYEDPPFVYQGDLAERNEAGFKDRIPSGDPLSVSFNSSSGMSSPDDMAGLLQKLLHAHESANRGGHFRLMQNSQVFHVTPNEVEDRDGNWAPQSSILDVAISLPEKERTGMDTLLDICAAVGRSSHVRVDVGTTPINVIAHYRSTLSANEESARSVLMRALDGTNRKLTWMLLYDPQGKSYVLNILVVPKIRITTQSCATVPLTHLSRKGGIDN